MLRKFNLAEDREGILICISAVSPYIATRVYE